MYSGTFALTVVLGIAVINLFLGFAAALLLGRGPKSWSDADRAIVIQKVAIHRRQPRPRVERANTSRVVAAVAARPGVARAETAVAESAQPEASAAVARRTEDGAQSAAPTPAAAGTPASESLRLTLPLASPLHENEPPEKTLNQQLQAWRESDMSHETPSLSGLRTELAETSGDDAALEALSSVLLTRIKAQVRRDRRLLKIGPRGFAWFSPDVSPEDATLTVERIRQILQKTRFRYQGHPLAVSVVAGVVNGSSDGEADGLLQRLDAAWNQARAGEHPTCLDDGTGPKGVEPLDLEITETECELAQSGS